MKRKAENPAMAIKMSTLLEVSRWASNELRALQKIAYPSEGDMGRMDIWKRVYEHCRNQAKS